MTKFILHWACFALVAVLVATPINAQEMSPSQDQIIAAAQAGEPDAQYALGLIHHKGQGVLQDYTEAARWFSSAANQGHAAAQNHLARYRYEGLGGEKDVDAALALFAQAAETGDPQFVFDYALVSEANPETLALAVTLYTQAFEAGHLEAAVNLGVLYQDGKGVEQNFDRARELYEEPAKAGHARALNNLGLFYVRGNGVPQNYERAAQYFTAASELGLEIAMTNLGVLYENGFGVPLDEERAAALYRKGGGQPELKVGTAEQEPTLIYDGRLQPPDNTSEDALIKLADTAESGDPVALFQMAWLIAIVPDRPFENQAEAAGLFRKAALRGHGPSMLNLSILYFQGAGLPQDYVLGQMWLLLAVEAQVEGTAAVSAYYSGRLTSGQINEAQQRARLQHIQSAGHYHR